MRLWSQIKQGICKCDFFCSMEYLRYKSEPEYRTLLGGFMSIFLITSLMVVFSNKVINTLNMMSITSSTSLQVADDPTPLTITTKGPTRRTFMLGVEIWHHNLNEGDRYFDIKFKNMNFFYGEETNKSMEYALEPCTLDHWRGYPSIQEKYEELNMNYWLCLPKDLDFQISGKYSSMISQTLEVSVNKCNNSSNPLRPCADSQQIDDFFTNSSQKVFFTAYFINPRINPDEAEFLTYYLEDQNYIIFSQTGGEEAQLMMSDYNIVTDDSISPFPLYLTDAGGIIDKTAIKNRFEIAADNDNYCTFFFYKSPNSFEVTRSYQKLDEILSYIGGLFGTIAICLFIVRIYNEHSFEINLGAALYKHDEEKAKFNSYNFWQFIKQAVYKFLRLLGKGDDMIQSKGYQRCREELLKQLDVLYLLQRVCYLERAIEVVFEDHQLKGLHLLKKFTLHQAQRYRRNFKLHEKAIQECQNYQYLRKNSNTTGNPQSIPFFRSNTIENEDSISYTDQNLEMPRIESDRKDPQNNENKDSQSESSSDSQSSHSENTLTTMELLIRLRQEKDSSPISHRIYHNLNQVLKDLIEKDVENPQPSEKKESAQQIVNTINTIDFKPKRRYASTANLPKIALGKLLQPLEEVEHENSLEENLHKFQSISNC